ncbi:MAG: hypothetical protein JNJ46_13605 [Myxococcales bacterium]|nr:hypothetical protein [Myxococcales bacterium]
MMKPFTSLSTIVGQPMPPGEIIRVIRQYKWSLTFVKLARIAAAISAEENLLGSFVKLHSNQILASFQSNDPNRTSQQAAIETQVSTYFRQNPDSIIYHEQLIYFMQALCILEGAEHGEEPPDTLLAFYCLAANDYVHSWKDQDSSALTDLERLVAELALSSRFNRSSDSLRDFIRMYMILNEKPLKSKLIERWSELQNEAFGMPFEEFFHIVIGPAVLMAEGWGQINEHGRRNNPNVKPKEWFSHTKLLQGSDRSPSVAHTFFRNLTSSRTEAREEIHPHRTSDGLPHAPILFYKKPFIEIEDDLIYAASPTVARQQLSTGIWAAGLSAAKKLFPKEPLLWFYTFGKMLELWARRVATEASKGDRFRGRLILSHDVGSHDEIEDVILMEGRNVALFSVKSSLIREKSIKRALSRSEAISWYNEFLFSDKTSVPTGSRQETRGGAFRLLNATIDRIRNGESAEIHANQKLFPVLVTFDDLGDNEILYKWIRMRCKQESLFRPRNVMPPSIMTISEFEMLMGLAYQGASIFKVLRQRADSQKCGLPTKEVLLECSIKSELEILPFLRDIFEQVTNRIQERLFRTAELPE